MQYGPSPEPGSGSGARTQVLVVEDDAGVAALLVDVLRQEGYLAVSVSDGVAALRFLKTSERPCLILLDLLMPAMDGFEFRRLQRSDPVLGSIPVAVISAVAAWYKTENPMGAVAYIDKPLEMNRVLATVMQHCGLPVQRGRGTLAAW